MDYRHHRRYAKRRQGEQDDSSRRDGNVRKSVYLFRGAEKSGVTRPRHGSWRPATGLEKFMLRHTHGAVTTDGKKAEIHRRTASCAIFSQTEREEQEESHLLVVGISLAQEMLLFTQKGRRRGRADRKAC